MTIATETSIKRKTDICFVLFFTTSTSGVADWAEVWDVNGKHRKPRAQQEENDVCIAPCSQSSWGVWGATFTAL